MSRSLTGRTALITGANQGLGLAFARAYVQAGASVLMCARDAALLKKARRDVEALAESGQVVDAETTDVSEPDQGERLVARALALFPRLHVLVNNAGVYGPMGTIETVDWT